MKFSTEGTKTPFLKDKHPKDKSSKKRGLHLDKSVYYRFENSQVCKPYPKLRI
jgi:hypothetical protein